MPLERALTGCQDEWNSLDHFDPTSPVRKVLSHFTHLRAQYPALQDGFNLAQRGNWTSFGQLPGSNMTQTEWGFWSVTRSPSDQQQFTGPNGNTTVWMLYSNLNTTKTFEFDCGTQLWISAPYPAPLTVRNLIYPYETYNLAGSKSPYYLDGKAPYRGCLQSVTMDALGFKVLVPADNWVAPLPQLVHFTPGHDARILSRSDTDSNPIAISLSFSDEMSCQSVSESLSLAYVIDPASSHQPRLNVNSATCTSIPPVPSSISSAPAAVWTWSSQIEDAPDGIYELIIKNPTNKAGLHTQSTDHLLIRKGSRDNPIAFQTTSYSKSLLQKGSDGLFQIFSNAAGADLMRYSTDFGKTWMKWQPYARAVGLPAGSFSQAQFWEGNHIRVQYWSKLAGSAAQTVDSDYGYSGTDIRTVPQLLLRGPFNQWLAEMS
ncbi:Cell wall alpha-1,3-glucan synthase ags1 [Puccinia graminis f. sp. tritici]|uniref:Cell wall alpha-1,3-glucan synthase ags1 n=1 Tax=Puccinia graminis f. sp. tritici TaxID=56615 RepID=A0A5B0QS94_PUCGR|nr:Cell wall alpha-1,3-glucan synthase ags1 [Puccinia graminis f. sp. tritici]